MNNWKKWLGIAFLLFIVILIFSPSGEKQEEKNKPVTEKNEVAEATVEVPENVPEYTIIHTLDKYRYDDAPQFYVLLSQPVDTSSDAFKDDIKAIVLDLVSKHGKKISIEIYDNRDALDVSYKQYGDMSLGRVRTDAESKLLERHQVATFDGEMETGLYPNTLSYYPSATTKVAEVGQYVDSLEFNP